MHPAYIRARAVRLRHSLPRGHHLTAGSRVLSAEMRVRLPLALPSTAQLKGAGIPRLSFKQDAAGSIPVCATNFGGMGKRSATCFGNRASRGFDSLFPHHLFVRIGA